MIILNSKLRKKKGGFSELEKEWIEADHIQNCQPFRSYWERVFEWEDLEFGEKLEIANKGLS